MKKKRKVAEAVIRECVVSNMRSGRCKNGSYYRKFRANYYDFYYDDSGEKVFVNMEQWIAGFNDVARMIKADISEGDTLYLMGDLKSRPLENYAVEVFIEIDDIANIVKLPGGWNESG